VIERPKQPPPSPWEEDDDFGNAFPDEEQPTSPGRELAPAEGVNEERPTVSPPFDLEEFARTSDSKLRASRQPKKEIDASTKPPPAPDSGSVDVDVVDDFELEVAESISSGKMPAAMRPPQITMTDEDELETARLRSVLIPSDPPPGGRRAIDPMNTPPPTVQYPGEHDPFASAPAPPGAPGERGKAPLPLREMHDRVSLGDYSGALEIAESILQIDPVNADAIECAEECRSTLQQMYTARIGPMDRVPVVMVPREQLRWLSIDHRAGFLLSHIDGVSSLEMILDVSGMPTLDALKILCELAQQRVISFR
jgi:hypothetical protein